MLLEGKVAIVSGVGPGLGRSIALACAREGALLVVGDASSDAVEGAVAAVTEAGGTITGQVCDITDADACQALVDSALSTHGHIDVLVNDAYHGGDFSSFEDADLANWRAVSDVNWLGTLQLCQKAVPSMKAQGRGHIVMINTQGVEWLQTMFGAYTGSKAALQNSTRLLATELGAHGIRVNGVHPGPIWGPAIETHLRGLAEGRGVDYQVVYDEWADATCLKYLVPPEEIADAVVFLASDLARAITGQSLFVNGGHWFH